MKVIINNQELVCESGKTILAVAVENGIEIPTLCHDESMEIYGSCGICMVEVEGNPRLLRACATPASDGMVVATESERISANRRLVLELMLSDHAGDCKPPCASACPADTDCMGYVRLIGEGRLDEAAARIRERIPFPASIGRVCPRPCESACRRGLVEESVSIGALKQYAGDNAAGTLPPTLCPPSRGEGGVLVIGGGPAGLSAAYYLRLMGYAVTVCEEQAEMGGMLRYGVPEFRLPDTVLQSEIDMIKQTGVEFRNNTRVELSDVRDKYDAVIVAIGAWKSVKLNIPDEIGGTDFLRGVAEGNPDVVGLASRGSRVSVIGGGNTAMDVCRVALRSGAEKVYCVYRRTREEMPAEPHEVEAAEKEGVEFLFSTPPDRIPDDVNVVISAIGNKPRLDGFDELEVTDWGTIVTHPDTFLTSTKTASGSPVFAIGDATNKGTDIAARAIGEGRKCAGAVDDFLSGKPVKDSKSVMSVKSEKTAEDFAHIARQARVEITDKQSAREEAKRCLECGCNAYAERSCKLYRYANLYGARADAYSGERHDGKCIMCGLCVRAFDDVLGFVNRGFDVRVQAENLSADFEKCPTGAYYDMMRGN